MLAQKPSVSDLESISLAGFFAFIGSNLCTRYIQSKLTTRGHHDWRNRRQKRRSGCFWCVVVRPFVPGAMSEDRFLRER
jgi:hypothetical protein